MLLINEEVGGKFQKLPQFKHLHYNQKHSISGGDLQFYPSSFSLLKKKKGMSVIKITSGDSEELKCFSRILRNFYFDFDALTFDYYSEIYQRSEGKKERQEKNHCGVVHGRIWIKIYPEPFLNRISSCKQTFKRQRNINMLGNSQFVRA